LKENKQNNYLPVGESA